MLSLTWIHSILVLVLFAGRTTLATGDAAWAFDLPSPLVNERLDPIVNPNGVSSHMHRVFGGSGFKAAYNYDDQVKAKCTNFPVSADKSNYWVPQLYWQVKDSNNVTTAFVPLRGAARIYYVIYGKQAGGNVTAFPKGLRMLSGSPNNKAADPTLSFRRWTCQVSQPEGFAGNLGGSDWNFPRDCPQGLKSQINFPPCWDGVNLYKSDGSHVTFPGNGGEGITAPCPVTHPVRMPAIQLEMVWWPSEWAPGQAVGGRLAWANGDTTSYGIHADFTNGWDDTLQQALDDPNCFGFSGSVPFQSCPTLAAKSQSTSVCTVPDAGVQQEEYGNADNVPIPSLPGCNPLWGATGAKPGCTSTPFTPDVTPFKGTDGAYILPASQQLNTSLPTSPGWHYMYCGVDSVVFQGQVAYADDKMTLERCQDSCAASGYSWAGMGAIPYFQCKCGTGILPTVKQSSGCTTPCPGNSNEMCGSTTRTSIYYMPPGVDPATRPGSLGCYSQPSDVTTALMASENYKFVSKVMTSAICQQTCAYRGATWAATTLGTDCYCGNDATFLPGTFQPPDFCNTPCAGNASESCGAARLLNVYNVMNMQTKNDTTSKPTGWLGCFNEPSSYTHALSSYSFQDSAMTPSKCIDGCASLGYSFGGVENGNYCYCGNDYSAASQIPSSLCTSTCAGNAAQTCGAAVYFEAYSTASSSYAQAAVAAAHSPGYIGCYYTPGATDGYSDYSYTSASLTVESCISGCKGFGYAYAGMQNGATCKCGKTPLTIAARPELYCSSKCAGNATETCGGSNYMNAYSIANNTAGVAAGSSAVNQFVGCYTDGRSNGGYAPYGFSDAAMTVNLCRVGCKEIGYSNAILAGQKCYCDTTWHGGQILPPSQCTTACPGNSTEICGGTSVASVFGTSAAAAPAQIAPSGYVGCYQNPAFPTGFTYSGSDMTVELCQQACLGQNSALTGLKNGNTCYCGNSITSTLKVPTSLCNLPCGGKSSELCGAGSLVSVFNTTATSLGSTVPGSTTPGSTSPSTNGTSSSLSAAKSLGCYSDVSTVRLGAYSGNYMSGEICSAVCAKMGYAYAALWQGSTCRCGNSPPTQPALASSCSIQCTGDAKQTCGAANYVNAWATNGDTSFLGPATTLGGVGGYMGCYGYSNGANLQPGATLVTSTAMTVQTCVSNCANVGYKYAGLQNANRCYCSNVANATAQAPRQADGNCNVACNGNSAQMCGASTSTSIYDVSQSGISAVNNPSGSSGCYAQGTFITSAAYTYKETMTPDLCRRVCYNRGYPNVGLSYTNQCSCSSNKDYGAQQPPLMCASACTGNNTLTCGGSGYISLYDAAAVVPSGYPANYVGCYWNSDAGPKTGFSTSSSSMTATGCASICSVKGYSQYGLSGGNTCQCMTSFPATQRPDSVCGTPCTGSASQQCGGSSAISMYSMNGKPYGVSAPVIPVVNSSSVATASRTASASVSASLSKNATVSATATPSVVAGSVGISAPVPASSMKPSSASSTNAGSAVTSTAATSGRLSSASYSSVASASKPASASASSSASTSSKASSILVSASSSKATSSSAASASSSKASSTSASVSSTKASSAASSSMSQSASIKASSSGAASASASSSSKASSSAASTSASSSKASSTSYSAASSKASSSSSGSASSIKASSTSASISSSSSVKSSSTTASPAQPTATFTGFTFNACVADASPKRAINWTATYTGTDLTIEKCASKCAGMTYMGLEAGNQCYCSNILMMNTTVASSQCSTACSGSILQPCGGATVMSLYVNKSLLAAASSSSSKPASSSSSTATTKASSAPVTAGYIATGSAGSCDAGATSTATVYVTVTKAATTTGSARRRSAYNRRRAVRHIRAGDRE